MNGINPVGIDKREKETKESSEVSKGILVPFITIF